MNVYSTRNEAIEAEIITPLGEFADDHDIDAIADKLITTTGEGTDYGFTLDEGADFWDVVANNQI